MFDQSSPFFRRSIRIAEEFLQTTVIVDDQAYFEGKTPVSEAPSPTPTDLREPGRRSGVSRQKEILVEPDEEIPLEIGSHYLNAQKVINSFAQKHIVCSVIKPTEGDTYWITSVENLASSADIIIVDWELNKDNGKNALNILEQIIKSAIETPAQLRLFAIYTGEPKIAQIAKDVKATLEERLQVGIDAKDDGFSLTFASNRIVIFAKPGTSNLPQEYERHKVSFEALADRVISEFAVMTAGLVSNVAIKSLALVRRNTHKILNKFSIHLDAPYLTHRALQVHPEDAEELLTALIADEVQAVLEEEHVGESANIDSIKDWISSLHASTLTLDLQEPKDFDQEKVVELLKLGIDKWDGAKKSKSYTLLTKMFRPQSLTDETLDEKFALITTIRSFYGKREPKLMFGTIIQKVEDKGYWVCLQPRCDCVRITSPRIFPFLPLTISDENRKFNFVLEEETKYIRLKLDDNPCDLNLITFAPHPNDNEMIVAIFENKAYYFTDIQDTRYKWIGELRPEHAQRIANKFASNLSRVGLDESEWLRIWATKG